MLSDSPNKAPTMREVAQLAGVSVQTVSHVVNQTGSISSQTRRRVQQVIETLHYRPHPIARSMRTRETRLIGLLVLDITNPVLSHIASEIEAAAHASGYRVLLYNARHDARLEQQSLESFAERLVDGLIIVNAVDQNRTFEWLKKGAIATVLVDCLATASLPSVAMDNQQGAYLATKHLIELGHKDIAHLPGALSLEVARQRLAGYRQALKDFKLAKREWVMTPVNDLWDYGAGYLSTQQLLKRKKRPSAIFAAGDQMAIGVYRALAEEGLKIPEDMSVVGFDDIEAARYTTPPLTTVRQPLKDIASQAFGLLLELLNGTKNSNNPQIILPPELILRSSTRSMV
jgi:DNA-binding LacI/PurR family transcriptional regulator